MGVLIPQGSKIDISKFEDRTSISLETPFLFPVTNFFCSSTINGGGIWKYLRNQLFLKGYPGLLTQAVHFLDFNVTPAALRKFRRNTIQEQFQYNGVLFIDSAGFRLLNRNEFTGGNPRKPIKIPARPESVVPLQLDFGADLFSSLDIPILPSLINNEKMQRMETSLLFFKKTLKVLDNIQKGNGLRSERAATAKLCASLHGFDFKSAEWYVRELFDRTKGSLEDVRDQHLLGMCVGSLVPLRGRYINIFDILHGVKEGLLGTDGSQRPVFLHVYGISGDLIPLLCYLGVHTIDTSAHVNAAKVLEYVVPGTLKRVKLRKMSKLPCRCVACQNFNLKEDLKILNSKKKCQKIGGKFKSEIYANLAHHNFNQYVSMIDETKKFIEKGEGAHFLVKWVRKVKRPKLIQALAFLSRRDNELAEQMKKAGLPTKIYTKTRLGQDVSLLYKTTDFILPEKYSPPIDSLMLLLPCSSKKPYSESKSHYYISSKIKSEIKENATNLHIVTLSGLFGPIPQEFEKREEILRYDYYLQSNNGGQLTKVSERLEKYIKKYNEIYKDIVGYTTSKSYRKAIELAFENSEKGILLPKDLKHQNMNQYYKKENVQELIDFIHNLR